MTGLADRRWRVALPVVVAMLPVLVYANQLSAPLDSDAKFLSVQNASVRTPQGLTDFWTSDYFAGAITNGVPYRSGYYRPITNSLFWSEFRIFGDSETGYHLTQLLLHVLNVLLVFAVVWRLSGSRGVGLLTAALFGVHPIHAFAVSQPAARADVLFPLFYLSSILLFDAALMRESAIDYWKLAASTVCFVLAVLSKEMGITLPAVLVLIVLLRHYRDGYSLRHVQWTTPVWAIMGAYVLWRFVILDIPPPELGYADSNARPELLVAGIRSLFIQGSRVVVPLGPSFPELNPRLVNFLDNLWREPLTYIAATTVIACGIGALKWRSHPNLAFVCATTLVTFSPLMRVDNIAGSLGSNVVLAQERWFYLTSVPIIAAIVYAVMAFLNRMPRKPTVALGVMACVAVVSLGYTARVHAQQYTNAFAQLRQLYLFPEERLSRLERANKLILYAQWVALPRGELDEAEARTRAAVDLVPDSPVTAVALGVVLSARQEWSEVIRIVMPWMNPTEEDLRLHARTNPRVGDDLNRASGRIPFLLANAYARMDSASVAGPLFCEAAQRRYDLDLIRSAWSEVFPDRELTCTITRGGV